MSFKKTPLKTKEPNVRWARNLETGEHGGACCGREHLYGFEDIYDPSLTTRDKVAGIRDVIERRFGCGNNGKGVGVEVVLNNYQTDEWSVALSRVGFKKVFSFVNENSGNECFVYFLDTSKMK